MDCSEYKAAMHIDCGCCSVHCGSLICIAAGDLRVTHQKSNSSPAAAASFFGLVATMYNSEADRGSGDRSAKGRMILPMVLLMVVLQQQEEEEEKDEVRASMGGDRHSDRFGAAHRSIAHRYNQ